jgi:hypothetical protein
VIKLKQRHKECLIYAQLSFEIRQEISGTLNITLLIVFKRHYFRRLIKRLPG